MVTPLLEFSRLECTQLDGLRIAVSSEERWLPNSAVQLRTCISEQLQVNALQPSMNLLFVCAVLQTHVAMHCRVHCSELMPNSCWLRG